MYDVAILGAGPTGMSAAFHAHTRGMRSVVIDRAATILPGISSYTEGTEFVSGPMHFEVGRYPLDCERIHKFKREDALYYYARVAAVIDTVDWRLEHRVIRLEPASGHIALTAETAGGVVTLTARKVVNTAWYRRRELPRASAPLAPRVVPWLPAPHHALGRRVTLVGAGMSAAEQANILVRLGVPFAVAMRGTMEQSLHDTATRTWIRQRGVPVYENLRDLRVEEPGLVATDARGATIAIPCDLVVATLGQELDPDILTLLSDCGALTDDKARGLASARPPDTLIRKGLVPPGESGFWMAVAERPCFWDELVHGRHNIHFAGGALQCGGNYAGTTGSIYSGELAVRAIAGEIRERLSSKPLAHFLAEYTLASRTFPVHGSVKPRYWDGYVLWWDAPDRVADVERPTPVDVDDWQLVEGEEGLRELDGEATLDDLDDGDGRAHEVLRGAFYGKKRLTWFP